MRWTRTTALVAAVALALGGCAANRPASGLSEGPRMIDLYRGAGVGADGGEAPGIEDPRPARRCRWWLIAWPCGAVEPKPAGEPAPEPSYARTAANELKLLFPRLPNPDIYIYVAPHLATEEQVPVPGYTTAVPLYERVEYALPGEAGMAGRRGAEASP